MRMERRGGSGVDGVDERRRLSVSWRMDKIVKMERRGGWGVNGVEGRKRVVCVLARGSKVWWTKEQGGYTAEDVDGRRKVT